MAESATPSCKPLHASAVLLVAVGERQSETVFMTGLREAVISMYRAELKRRYTPDHIHGYDAYGAISKESIQRMASFFLSSVYPPPAERAKRDAAFEDMGAVLRSPRKMWPLFGTAVSSVWKLGRQLPAALRTGWTTLELYLESSRMEEDLARVATDLGLGPSQIANREVFANLIASVPAADVEDFRTDILKLFRALANSALLETSISVMQHSRDIMEKHADRYTERELAGLELGINMLTQGYELFSSLAADEVALILEGIERIEIDWYRAMLSSAAASGPR